MKKHIKKWLLFPLTSLLLAACSLPGLGASVNNEGIVITGGTTTEMQLLSYMVRGMVEHYLPDASVDMVNNLGSSTLNHQAMIGGDANVSAVRYTGTSLTGELGMEPLTDPALAFETVVEGFDEQFNQVWFPSYGFANTYAFLVTREFAEENNLETISDLAALAPNLRAGVDNSWMEREGDGYEAFKENYGFDFQRVYPMQVGLVYDALQADEMDIVLGYSTDGRIASYDLVVLEDDLQLFPPYDASPVATKEILEAYPELETILLKLEDTLTDEMMQAMNYEVDNDLVEAQTVAQNFLEANSYFEDKKVTSLKEGK